MKVSLPVLSEETSLEELWKGERHDSVLTVLEGQSRNENRLWCAGTVPDRVPQRNLDDSLGDISDFI